MPIAPARRPAPAGWAKSPLSPATRAALLDTALLLRSRLSDRDRVFAAIAGADRVTTAGSVIEPTSLANGPAGIALALAISSDLSEQDALGTEAMTEWMMEGVAATSSAPVEDPSLYGGSVGIAVALMQVTEHEPRFARMTTALLESIERQIDVDAVADFSAGCAVEDYDVVSGCSGMLAGLLAADEFAGPRRFSGAVAALERTLNDLVSATPNHGSVGWLVVPELMQDEHRREMAPEGYADTGLAHGASGILAALGLLVSAGRAVDARTATSLDILSRWLDACRTDDSFGPNWPTLLPREGVGQRDGHSLQSRTAWCYGAPGVALALSHAARGGSRVATSIDLEVILRGIGSRVASGTALGTANLCHGSAGLAVLARHLHSDTGSEAAAALLEPLAIDVLSRIDEATPLGIQDIEPGGIAVDNPTLLNGSAGVLASIQILLATTKPTWSRFLLAG